MRFSAREDVLSITPLNPFDRFDDGRPKVPDNLIEEMKLVTAEEARTVLLKHNYTCQFDGDWVNLHPERVLVGRAITATMVPKRPDLDDVVSAQGEREGRRRSRLQSRWVISTMGENDVAVVNIFGRIKDGSFIGDNLAIGISSLKAAGLVIDGAIRDPGGIYDVPNINVFCRGVDPGVVAATLISLNGPTRIGEATVLPGDIVLGTRVGVTFIPPHLVEEVVTTSKGIRLQDEFRQQRLQEGKYAFDEVYSPGMHYGWADEIEADFQEWCKQRQSQPPPPEIRV